MPAPVEPMTFASPSLPPVSEFTSFASSVVMPEIIRWFVFLGGILIVAAVIKRLSGK